ncbi:MAG TPA: tetratricopeptide repeat protein [Candidatus Binatia bacterium]|nr:tetratricopeptide repeat protein [Candidatus Binatia bacterium]
MSSAPSGEICPRCGAALTTAEGECTECTGKGARFTGSRQTAVLLSMALLAALFLLTGFMTRAFLRHEEDLARQWFEKGQAALAAGNPDAAVEALHNALAYSNDDFGFELTLARALLASHRESEAEAYLRTLHESQPGNSPVDLELARLAVNRGQSSDAIRYYVAAIYGVWDADGEQRRRQTRLELIAFLTRLHRSSEALAQTMSFAANLPPDPALHVRAGQLFLDQQSYDHALAEFKEALRLDPRNPQALAGAGRALFAGGKFAEALPGLEHAHRAAPGDEVVQSELALSRAVVALDTDAPGLSARTRAERLLHDFQIAGDRLAACSAREPREAAGRLAEPNRRFQELKPKLKEKALLRDMELFDSAVNAVLASELRTAEVCGPGSVEDQALVLLARRRLGGPR